MIQAFKWFVHEKMDVPDANSKKADAYASKIIDVLQSEDRKYINAFAKCQDIIDKVGFPTADALKRGRFSQELADAVRAKIAR